MRRALLLAALCAVATGPDAAGAAPTRSAAPLRAANCSTSVVFGEPYRREQTTVFRATITVSCPLGVAFSAVFRSENACALRSPAGPALRYEMYADAALQSALVSCRRTTEPLRGSGRQIFVVYGRVDDPAVPAGRFSDALLATISV